MHQFNKSSCTHSVFIYNGLGMPYNALWAPLQVMCCPDFFASGIRFWVPARAEMDLMEVCMDLKILCVYIFVRASTHVVV